MVVPVRLDQAEARRRFAAARQLVERGGPAPASETLARIDGSLEAALEARSRLVDSARVLDQATLDAELKRAIRRSGPDSAEVTAIRRRRQVAVDIQDEIDAVDRHVHETILDVEALAAEAKASASRFQREGAADIGRRMQDDLAQLRADAQALDAARRELEGL